jgi:phage baseplate assembly protein gpV
MSDKIEMNDLLSMAVNNRLEGLYVTLPAKVVSYDNATQKAVVQPLIKHRDRDGDNNTLGLVDMPVISGVLVIQPATPEGCVFFPIKAGWNVLLHFCSKSIDNYLDGSGESPVDPQDYRLHQYSDCFATIGMSTFSNALGSDPSDFVIRFNVGTANENKVALHANGDVTVDTPTKFIVNATGNVEVNTSADAIVNASGNMTATIGGDTTIDCGQTTITGDLRVDGEVSTGGDVETDAGFSANNHVHIANLGKPSSKFI